MEQEPFGQRFFWRNEKNTKKAKCTNDAAFAAGILKILTKLTMYGNMLMKFHI